MLIIKHSDDSGGSSTESSCFVGVRPTQRLGWLKCQKIALMVMPAQFLQHVVFQITCEGPQQHDGKAFLRHGACTRKSSHSIQHLHCLMPSNDSVAQITGDGYKCVVTKRPAANAGSTPSAATLKKSLFPLQEIKVHNRTTKHLLCS